MSLPEQKLELRGFTRAAVEALSKAKGEPEWLLGRRLEAWHIFADTPMPTPNDELWRRTPIADLDFEDYAPFVLSGEPVSGFHELPEPPELRRQGVIFCSLDEAVLEHPSLVEPYLAVEAVPPTEGKFEALSAAFWSGGSFLYVPRGVEATLPLRAVTRLQDPAAALVTRNLVVAGEGSSVSFVDHCVSAGQEASPGGRPLAVGGVEIYAQQGARVNYLSLQDWDQSVWDFTSKRALVGRDASANWLVGTFGGKLTKSMVGSTLQGFGATTLMLGLFFAQGGQHLDMDTRQVHQAGHTTSDLLFKGATQPRGRSIYYGLIKVDPDAQRTDAYQANRTLLLGERARHDSIPSLEIKANDVRCTHGSTTGRVDEDMIFYARSRGISRADAMRLIVEAFFEDVIDRVPVAAVQDQLRHLVAAKLYPTNGTGASNGAGASNGTGS